MQMRVALQALLYGALSTGYFDHVTVGSMPGTVADLLQFLASVDSTEAGDIESEDVDKFEQATLDGKVILESEGKAGRQAVLFHPKGLTQRLPIEYAATSAAELAPLLLYLRHSADFSDAVFIDEPEAHFHPKSQMALARHLLVMSEFLDGLVLATHSDFLASGLSNALLESYAEYDSAPTVGLYEFCMPDSPKKGVEVRRIEFDPTDGFDVGQFSAVSDDAYDRAISLYNDLHADKG
jgi:hypothetical protein